MSTAVDGADQPVRGQTADPAVTSEVGTLEAVVVHTPGAEIESMTPRAAKDLLYNEIIPLSAVADEHRLLKSFLSQNSNVFEVTDLVGRACADEAVRRRLVERVVAVGCEAVPALRERVRDRLLECDPVEQAHRIVRGVAAEPTTLSAVLSGRDYDLPPLPNMYFTRDSAAVIRDAVVIGAMAYPVRTIEALLMQTALTALSVDRDLLLDGSRSVTDGAVPGVTMEGGDLLVLRRDLLVVGVSERTTAAAIDLLAARVSTRFGEPVTIVAVILPKKRYAIHLDMLFTLVDRASALIYEPLFVGAGRLAAYRIDIVPGRTPRITRKEGLLEALSELGHTLELIRCGGSDPVAAQREQWLSAANVVAVSPGKVIGFDCNRATMEEFTRFGYEVRDIRTFVDGDDSLDRYHRVLVAMPGTNLARGGGGPRCMTMPVRRAALPA